MNNCDRRSSFRVKEALPVFLTIRDKESKKRSVFKGVAVNIGVNGLCVSTEQVLPTVNKGVIEITLPSLLQQFQARMKINWTDKEKYLYGIELKGVSEIFITEWQELIKKSTPILDRRGKSTDRRSHGRTPSSSPMDSDKRKGFRRISDLNGIKRFGSNGKLVLMTRADLIPNQKNARYTIEDEESRRNWLGSKIGINFKHIAMSSEDPKNLQGNIENFIGMTQVPIGIAGPLKINGEYAKGDFYIPLATTEGALVYTYTIGMQVLTMAGGVSAKVKRDETHISPLFTFNSAEQADQFCQWLEANFVLIKKHAEQTTKHGLLLKLEPLVYDKNVTVKFCYSTADAMGLNMINFATEAACKFIVPIIKPERFYMRSNFSSVKKVSSHNYSSGMGKTVISEATVPAEIIKRIFEVTPSEIVTYFNSAILSAVHAGMVGNNGHVANGLTALFIACGQDVASIVDSHIGITNFEVTKEGDLYASLKLPNLVIGTVGGGTDLGTQRECLEMIGCHGTGKVKKFAEIIGALSLAGELTVCANVANGKFVDAHKTYGRKNKVTDACPIV